MKIETITTVELTGSEVVIENIGNNYANVLNRGSVENYVSAFPDIVADSDGVVPVLAGQSVVVQINGSLYASGNGKITVIGCDEPINFFKSAPVSGGGSSGGTIDTQARTLINNHVGNAAVHTTAAEKAVWNAAESNAKLYADSLFQSATNLELEIVTALPSNPATNKIYLIELSGSPGNYSEHVYINGAWVNVGTTAINLAQYYDIAQTNALLAQKASLSDIPTKTSELTNDSGFITSPDGGNAATLNGHSIEITDVDPGEGVAMESGKIVMVVEP